MMEDMNRGFSEAVQRAGNGANGAAFHQASFMSYRNDGQGPPKVFQASTATKAGPGGVRETRKSLRDSERELEKMSIGHHIHDRGHEVEKHRNTRSGRTEELQNYHNLDEKDAEAFDQEWRNKTRTAFKGLEDVERRGGNLREIRDRRYEDEYPSDRDRRQSDRRERGGEKQLALPAPRAPIGNDARSPTGSEARGSEHWGRSQGRERS
ncbi:myeloid leukemia factor 1-like [Dreissena polymorpha]|uniref:Myeloid leukemia factor n=1 Tax=Dreissena polymorpha TaxID=45954 RepID=A0A9D4GKV4_DREPO|nr:myeloid leukemia factor 1-like [Dreissena polymorpha]XP_052286719.1 myeloid leukemia factor 1-like [Dreissena polymorpha]XP_052286720.1 myeloid leukemia factor 1-like [Dreissena polymorpha]KAH3817301.1 hypothetical protein DPMN_118834 [Dreissena polymorpha]